MPASALPAPRAASPGRPRDPRRDKAIRDAALRLLSQIGYERMTMDAIAAAAGVSKPTVYRRWPGKQELVADALRCHPRASATVPDTGSLRGDLIALVRQTADRHLENAHVAAGLASRLRESAELAQLIREHAIEAVRRRFRVLLDRAVARGELPADTAVSPLFAAVAPSLIHARVLWTAEPVDDAFVAELVDRILLPIVSASRVPA